jgi:hypothetical protein
MTFETVNLIEAALMHMRTQRGPQCVHDDRRHCTFKYEGVHEDDVEYARSNPLVHAREFNYALVNIKTAMYSTQPAGRG